MSTSPYAPDCEIVRTDDGDLLVTHLDSGRRRIAHTDRRALLLGAALAIAHTWRAARDDEGDSPTDEPQPTPDPARDPCANGHLGPFIAWARFRKCQACGSTSMEP